MRRIFLLALTVITFLLCNDVKAQLPEESTAANPIWYYIEVKGSDSGRELLVWTAEGTIMYGKAVNTASQTSIDAQLFRFEKDGDNYYIINKATGTKADMTGSGNDSYIALSAAGIPFALKEISGTPYYGIEMTTANAGYIYSHQGNNGYSFRIILTSTSYGYGANSQFAFIPANMMSVDYSTSTMNVWYKVSNASLTDKYFEDSASSASKVNLSLNDKSDIENQLWKITQNGTKVSLINKGTANYIQTKSTVDRTEPLYNYILLTGEAGDSEGWTLNYVGAGQYVLEGVEEDGNTRYLCAVTEGTAADEYDQSKLPFSAFAWKFEKISTEGVSIPDVQAVGEFNVYSEDRKIVVTGTDDYTVRNVQGITVNKEAQLPVGIYLVTVNGKTTKILVK